MATSRFVPDRGLGVRMIAVFLLLVVVYAAALTALVLLLGRAWPLGVAVVCGFLAFQLLSSDRVALRAIGAHEVTADEQPELHAVVDRLCALADMPKPRLAVAPSRVPNALAVGRSRKRVVVCVTRGLLDGRLEPPELEAVLAHELAHVAHDDAVVMTIASFIGVLAGFVARAGSRVLYFGGRGRGAWHIMLVALGLLTLSGLTWLLSTVLVRALSRYREFAADRSAATLTGNPSAVAGALAKLSAPTGVIPKADLRRASSVAAFAFCPPTARRGRLAGVFATHPSLRRRLDRLAAMSGTLSR